MSILVNVIIEYNNYGYLIYADNFVGAYSRGRTKEEALRKLKNEILQYNQWAYKTDIDDNAIKVDIIKEVKSKAQVSDGDSEVIFDSEKIAITFEEYENLKSLVLKSSFDFQILYNSISSKNTSVKKLRKTFYGNVPITAKEMYEHTNNVSKYYASEIGITIVNLNNIVNNRKYFFDCVESSKSYLNNHVFRGNCKEEWTLKKVMRRFIWHDRIHAKAMWRLASQIENENEFLNPFCFK
ncbi:hypothetical protein JYG23_03440 [Sedimentibacter sp. zth1]|uniref:hypothetical protein n=1 Tax=Sedimentibacter sp. zth1 TaxID=2816908 RepID=UPI001A92F29D|nr:hypothetical protein [Sedimentibacter sp. zth1]QSX06523.1 hypothetical protein JYG23_03440 [Sedimentibacter sp. zth1]